MRQPLFSKRTSRLLEHGHRDFDDSFTRWRFLVHDVTLDGNRVFVCREDGWAVVTTAISTGNPRRLHVILPFMHACDLTLDRRATERQGTSTLPHRIADQIMRRP